MYCINKLHAWYPRRDSNADLLLRTELFYPLNYGDVASRLYCTRKLALLLTRLCKLLVDGAIAIDFIGLKPMGNLFLSFS